MRLWKPLLLTLALLLPTGALASPVTMEVLNGSVPGFGFSWLHAPTGCESDGYWMCGNPKHQITGSLTADQVGSAFDDIMGQFTIDATVYEVTGSLDFGVAAGASIGSLTVGSLGTFDFVNVNFSGPANGYVGDTIYLWGQNFAPTVDPPKDGWGIDLGMKVQPAIPEPGAFAVFAIGALMVGHTARRRRA